MRKTKQLNIRITENLFKKLKLYCFLRGQKVTTAIERAIEGIVRGQQEPSSDEEKE